MSGHSGHPGLSGHLGLSGHPGLSVGFGHSGHNLHNLQNFQFCLAHLWTDFQSCFLL